jgi:hypothetical protein
MSRDALAGTVRVTSCWLEAGYTLAAGAGIALFCAAFLLRDPCFYWHDDFQTAFLPNYCDIARALNEGEIPLRSPFSWQGGALGGEYQYGIFSVWMLGCIYAVFALGLALPMKAAVLSILHLAVLAGGAFRLARRRGLTLAESGLVVLSASLNGWIFLFGAMTWFGHLAAFAWLPWVWWALERAVEQKEGACRFLPAGVFLYLLLAAGWPFAVVMAGMVSVWLALRNRRSLRDLMRLWPIAAAWVVGLGLSSPAWLMLLEFTPHTMRGRTPPWQLNTEWLVPLSALPGLIFPPLITEWSIFDHGEVPRRCMELTGGLVPVIVLAAALLRLRGPFLRRAGWELGLAGFLLLLCLVPTLSNFRYSFRWLPFFFLTLGLAAGQALALFRQSGASLPRLGFWATLAVFVVWSTAIWRVPVYDHFAVLYALLLLSGCLAWTWVERRKPAWTELNSTIMCLITLVICWVGYPVATNDLSVNSWPFTAESFQNQLAASDIRYFSAYREEDAFGRASIDLHAGNFGLYRGIHMINGYSAMRLAGLTELFGFDDCWGYMPECCARRILSRETGPDGLLALMGVDGLILARHYESFVPELEQRGWRVAASTEDALVLHRQGLASPRVRVLQRAEHCNDQRHILYRLRYRPEGPLPLLLGASDTAAEPLILGSAEVEVVKEERNRIIIEVRNSSTDRSVLVAASEPWYPGYIARFNGRAIPVQVLDLIIPAVLLPPGAEGQLIMEYRPPSLVRGRAIAVGTLFSIILFAVVAWKRKLANPRVSSTPFKPVTSAR